MVASGEGLERKRVHLTRRRLAIGSVGVGAGRASYGGAAHSAGVEVTIMESFNDRMNNPMNG